MATPEGRPNARTRVPIDDMDPASQPGMVEVYRKIPSLSLPLLLFLSFPLSSHVACLAVPIEARMKVFPSGYNIKRCTSGGGRASGTLAGVRVKTDATRCVPSGLGW